MKIRELSNEEIIQLFTGLVDLMIVNDYEDEIKMFYRPCREIVQKIETYLKTKVKK